MDEGGNANVVGYTYSTDFPVASPMQAVNAGYYDAFVLRLNTMGNMLVYSTFVGGSDSDYGLSIALDASGNAYVTGGTYSMDFPIADPFQASNGGDEDIFLLKLGSFAAPSEPLTLTAIPGDGHVILSWSAPNDDGGAPVDYYIVFKDGLDVAHPIATSFDMTGLTNGVAYTFAVAAHNSLGVGPTTPTTDATPSTDMVLPGVPTLLELTAGDSKCDDKLGTACQWWHWHRLLHNLQQWRGRQALDRTDNRDGRPDQWGRILLHGRRPQRRRDRAGDGGGTCHAESQLLRWLWRA